MTNKWLKNTGIISHFNLCILILNVLYNIAMEQKTSSISHVHRHFVQNMFCRTKCLSPTTIDEQVKHVSVSWVRIEWWIRDSWIRDSWIHDSWIRDSWIPISPVSMCVVCVNYNTCSITRCNVCHVCELWCLHVYRVCELQYGVAAMRRRLKIIGLFCRI